MVAYITKGRVPPVQGHVTTHGLAKEVEWGSPHLSFPQLPSGRKPRRADLHREHVPSDIPAAGNVPSQGLRVPQRSVVRLRKGSRRNLKIQRLNIENVEWTTIESQGVRLGEKTIKKHKGVAIFMVTWRKRCDMKGLGADKFCFVMWVVVTCLLIIQQ